jgi:hypothetical protein
MAINYAPSACWATYQDTAQQILSRDWEAAVWSLTNGRLRDISIHISQHPPFVSRNSYVFERPTLVKDGFGYLSKSVDLVYSERPFLAGVTSVLSASRGCPFGRRRPTTGHLGHNCNGRSLPGRSLIFGGID